MHDGVAEQAVELHRHRPHPALRGLVAGMVGLRERPGATVHRRQPAGSLLPLVLSWGEPLHVSMGPGGAEGSHAGFVAGLGRLPLAELATTSGYADQSHLAREFARFAGASPTALLAAAVPTPHTALAGAAR